MPAEDPTRAGLTFRRASAMGAGSVLGSTPGEPEMAEWTGWCSSSRSARYRLPLTWRSSATDQREPGPGSRPSSGHWRRSRSPFSGTQDIWRRREKRPPTEAALLRRHFQTSDADHDQTNAADAYGVGRFSGPLPPTASEEGSGGARTARR